MQHYSHSVAEYKAQVSELRKQLESTSGNLRALQNQLEHLRSEKQHFERESDRQADEAARLTAELNKVCVRQAMPLRDVHAYASAAPAYTAPQAMCGIYTACTLLPAMPLTNNCLLPLGDNRGTAAA